MTITTTTTTTTTTRQHYALIEKEGCHSLEITAQQKTTSCRDELEAIYQNYADLYPNPRLIEEKRQTDTLLQATRAASSARKETTKPTKRKGFFTSLFGSREDPTTVVAKEQDALGGDETSELEYTNIPNEHDDGMLCGTQQSLDVTCIPPEVYNVTRSHLSSTRTRRENPNALRWGPGSRMLTQQQQEGTSVIFVVVGLGEIAEFGGSTQQTRPTSDREDLLAHAKLSSSSSSNNNHDASSARGTVLSQNCIAISWGFQDGITVFYRRNRMGWEAVWWVGPSEPVLENLSEELIYDDAEVPSSPLLQITDCLALHVQGSHNEPIATLVVSRLGGYIELVPLPMALWTGPVLEKDFSRRKGRGRRQQHYATNVARPPNALALTTFEYHLDVHALEVHRTTVTNESEWNPELYPDGPPAEFILVASGVSTSGGIGETMTFWSISMICVDEEGQLPENPDDFSVHSKLLEAIWTGTGASVSTFCTPGIMSRWRTPRHVELKDTTKQGTSEEEDATAKPLAPVTTLSTTAPIVSMRFQGSFLSVLDWNGGVQIFDCSVIARLAAQNLTLEEYEDYRNLQNNSNQEQLDFQLVRCIVMRHQILKSLQKFAKLPSVRTMHWLDSTGKGLPSIVLVLSRCKKLAVLSFDQSLQPSTISVPFPMTGAAMESLADNCLSFVSSRMGTSKVAPNATIQRLRYFVMEELQPMAIVKTLARESKFEEAIQSASKLSKDEQEELSEVVVTCHRHLWETKRDTYSLIATEDELYILGEVLSICESHDHGFSIEDLRNLLKLALEIVSNHGEEEERVKKAFVRLGTFELLCKYYESNISLKQFQEEFLHVNMIVLSVELARRGDVPALSIILYRHRLEVHDKLFHVLGSLPLAMKPSSFCHLLPVIRNESFADLFLDSINENITELPWSHMPQYLSEKYLVSIAFDRFDEMLVLEYNKLSKDLEDESPTAKVVDWFVKRANKMQTFIGNVDDVVNFTKVGMRCSSVSHDGNNNDTGVFSVHELHTTGRTALSLKRMLLDQDVSIDGDGINTDDLMGMGLVELLDLVLDCGDQSSVVRYRFDEYIQPLVMEMSASSSSDHLDESVGAYCLNKAKNCNESEEAGAKDALSCVVAIAEISKASMPKKNRLIKNKTILIDMVLNVIEEMSKHIDSVAISMNDMREIIGSFWSLYETLPARLVAPESENEERLQKIYDGLVGADILSRWRGCNPFCFFNKCRSGRQDEGTAVVLEICESFTSAITAIVGAKDEVSLLQDLLCDVLSLNEVVFQNSVDLAKIICENLIPTFLEKGHFGLVASYLESEKSVVDRSLVIRNVVEYVDEAMFSDGDNMNRITNAMKCQDALEPILPEIQSLFQSNRRYLDASHFISTVLFEGKPSLSPSDLKEMLPLDVLETVLGEFPECIGCRCSQWLNPEYAQDANKLLRLGGKGNNEPPKIPGGAVFHLATILGLESNVSAVVVKSRVIHYALQGGYYGAGAAIARTLLHEKDFEANANVTVDEIKLSAVAHLVSIENYQDVCTKKELCETVLCHFERKVSFEHNESFNVILGVSSKLDFINSRFDQEVCTLPPERKEYLLSRPVARVYHHTFHEYKKDMHCLFKDLANQASDCLVHDSLMDVLSRFMFFWLVHDSITTKNVIDLRCKEDAQEYLKFACGMVLQIPSFDTAESSLRELQEIAFDQFGRVATEERFEASNNFILPNPDILRHLIQRGFTENAARRAATMTGNAGPGEAMAWAVGHAMDPDINSPMIMLKSSNRRMIDESSIQLLQKSVIQLSNILEDPLSRSAFLQSIMNRVPNASTNPTQARVIATKAKPKAKTKKVRPTPPKRITENKPKPPSKKPPSKENGTNKPVPTKAEEITFSKPIAAKSPRPPTKVVKPMPPLQKPPSKANETKVPVPTKMEEEVKPIKPAAPEKRRPPPPPPRARTPVTKPAVTKSVEKTQNNEAPTDNGVAKSMTAAKATAKPTVDREELLRRGKAALDRLKRGESAATKPQVAKAAATTTRTRTTTTRTPMDREALLKRGQEALHKLRNQKGAVASKPKIAVQKPSDDSRRKLIEEGRKLMLQTKSSKAGAVPTTKKAAPAPPPKAKPTPPPKAKPTPPPKAVKLTSDETEKADTGWDFDDFDNF